MSDTSLVDPSQSVYSSLGIPRGGDAAIGQAGKYLGEAAGAAEAENRDPEIARLREKKATLAERETSDDIYKHVEPFNPQNAPSAKDYTTDPVQSFFSLGSVFGILASAFTHQPWTTSMSAAAAAINARNQGDKDAYDYAFKEWQSNSDLMLKRHAAQIDDWNAIQEKYKNDQGALDAALQAHEAKYDDPAARALRLSGAYGQYYDLIDKRTQNGIAVQEARPGLVKAGMLTSALLGYQDALKSGDPAKISSARDAYTQLQSDFTGIKSTDLSEPMNVTVDDGKGGKRPVLAIFNKSTQQWISADGSATPLTGVTTATKIASGGTQLDPLTPEKLTSDAAQTATGQPLTQVVPGFGGAVANQRRQIHDAAIDLIKSQNKGMSDADAGVELARRNIQYLGLTSESRTTGTIAANLDVAGRAAYKAADLVLDKSAKVDRSDLVPLNNGEIGLRKAYSDPAVAQYLASLNTFINTYSRAINPRGVGRIADKEHARDLLIAGYGDNAIGGVLDTLKQEIGNEQSSVGESRQDIGAGVSGQSPAPLAARGSRDNPVQIDSEDQSSLYPKGTWVTMGGKRGQVQ